MQLLLLIEPCIGCLINRILSLLKLIRYRVHRLRFGQIFHIVISACFEMVVLAHRASSRHLTVARVVPAPTTCHAAGVFRIVCRWLHSADHRRLPSSGHFSDRVQSMILFQAEELRFLLTYYVKQQQPRGLSLARLSAVPLVVLRCTGRILI